MLPLVSLKMSGERDAISPQQIHCTGAIKPLHLLQILHPRDKQYTLLPLEHAALSNRVAAYYKFGLQYYGHGDDGEGKELADGGARQQERSRSHELHLRHDKSCGQNSKVS